MSEPDGVERCVRTPHVHASGLRYEAQAGTLRIRRDDHSALADVFYLAYRADSEAPRPLTFLFNGGPGSASLWLNVGGFGPKRAPTRTPQATPPAPYQFGDNPYTLLGDQRSGVPRRRRDRVLPARRRREAGRGVGCRQDVEAFARAITRYLTITDSWGAPRYLFGESYGTTRAAALVHRLQNLGLDFNGVILLSALLNWATVHVEMEDFRRLLLEADGKVVGRFDSRFVADHQYVRGTGSADPATDDAATAGVNSAHVSSFHRHLAEDLGYRTELQYRHLYNMTISRAWDWRHKAPGIDQPLQVPDVSLDLSAALRRNPNLGVYVMGGIYDLATPFLGAEYDIAHLYLAPRLRANVRFSWYESGHMTFVDEKAVAELAGDLASFYADTAQSAF